MDLDNEDSNKVGNFFESKFFNKKKWLEEWDNIGKLLLILSLIIFVFYLYVIFSNIK